METFFRVFTAVAVIGLAVVTGRTEPAVWGLGVIAVLALLGQEIASRRNRKEAKAGEQKRHEEQLQSIQYCRAFARIERS